MTKKIEEKTEKNIFFIDTQPTNINNVPKKNPINNIIKNKEEKKLKPSLIQDLEEKFEKRKSDDLGTIYESFTDQQIKVNCNLKCKKIENICPKVKSLIKLKDNNFLLYNKCEIFLYDSFLDNQLAYKYFENTISCISESKCDDENISIIISFKEENSFKLILGKYNDEIIFEIKELKINKLKIKISSANIFYEILKNKYLISSKEGTFFYDDDLGVNKYERL